MRRPRTSLLACLIVALAWVACSNPSRVEDRPQTLFVISFLTPGEDPTVRLLETVPPEAYFDGREAPVIGADVVLETSTTSLSLGEVVGQPGTYRIGHDALPVVAGETYQLTASHSGRQLRAQTTVPLPATVTRVEGDTITYQQRFADSFGELLHPGQFFWERSADAAGYVIIVEAEWVSTLNQGADTLTADLDTLIARRHRLEGVVSDDSLQVLDRQIEGLLAFFADNVSLTGDDGRTARWLRDREAEDWLEIEEDADSPGELWRDRRDELYWGRVIDYWIPADTLRSDYWWWGVRFTGDYRITLHAADTNYFDYYTTAFNGFSGADGDRGPIFHTEGGLGVFGSYSADSFTIFARREDDE
jgi:hypothetical protein